MTPSAVPGDAGTLVRTQGFVELWPEDLLDGEGPTSWLVVRSLPRQEKRLMADLRVQGFFGCFFGERRLRHYRGKGSQETRVPLLPGYLFVATTTTEKAALYRIGRIQMVLPAPRPVDLTRELQALRLLIERSPGPVMVRPEVVPGDRVEVTSGSLCGCQGVVQHRAGVDELVVNLEVLGSSVSSRLSAYTVERR